MKVNNDFVTGFLLPSWLIILVISLFLGPLSACEGFPSNVKVEISNDDETEIVSPEEIPEEEKEPRPDKGIAL